MQQQHARDLYLLEAVLRLAVQVGQVELADAALQTLNFV